MSTNYPGAIDNGTSLPYPTALNPRNGPSLAQGQDNQNDAIIATQTKLGTGASTPTNNNLLVGTGTGTSAWSKASPTGTIVGTTDSQTLTNKTLTSPTINSPVITNANITTDLITGFTSGTSGTIYGVPITSGVITTANTVNGNSIVAASIGTTALATNAVQGSQLATSAIKLGVTNVTSGSVTHTNTETTIASVVVTVPAGGRDVKLTCIVPQMYSTVSLDRVKVNFKESTTILQTFYNALAVANAIGSVGVVFETTIAAPSAGSHTYAITGTRDIGTGTVNWYNDALGATLKLVAELI